MNPEKQAIFDLVTLGYNVDCINLNVGFLTIRPLVNGQYLVSHDLGAPLDFDDPMMSYESLDDTPLDLNTNWNKTFNDLSEAVDLFVSLRDFG
jgi:hypothetical protein